MVGIWGVTRGIVRRVGGVLGVWGVVGWVKGVLCCVVGWRGDHGRRGGAPCLKIRGTAATLAHTLTRYESRRNINQQNVDMALKLHVISKEHGIIHANNISYNNK